MNLLRALHSLTAARTVPFTFGKFLCTEIRVSPDSRFHFSILNVILTTVFPIFCLNFQLKFQLIFIYSILSREGK